MKRPCSILGLIDELSKSKNLTSPPTRRQMFDLEAEAEMQIWRMAGVKARPKLAYDSRGKLVLIDLVIL